jgi:hypothetical protein
MEGGSNRKLTGRCMCGAVSYEVADEFMYAANCHCSRCRATTGSAFKPFAGIEREKIKVTLGADNLFIYGSKGHGDVHCGTCGSFLYTMLGDGVRVHVAMGSLVDAPSIKPAEHIMVAFKAPWFTITDDLPQYEGHVSDGPPINR